MTSQQCLFVFLQTLLRHRKLSQSLANPRVSLMSRKREQKEQAGCSDASPGQDGEVGLLTLLARG